MVLVHRHSVRVHSFVLMSLSLSLQIGSSSPFTFGSFVLLVLFQTFALPRNGNKKYRSDYKISIHIQLPSTCNSTFHPDNLFKTPWRSVLPSCFVASHSVTALYAMEYSNIHTANIFCSLTFFCLSFSLYRIRCGVWSTLNVQ